MITSAPPLAALFLLRHPFLGRSLADELAAIALDELCPQHGLEARRRASRELMPDNFPAVQQFGPGD